MWVFSPHRVLQVSTYLPNPCQPSLGVKECMCHAWGLVSHPGCLPRVPGMGFGSTATLTENKAACLGRKNTERTLFFTRVFSGFREDKPRQKYDLAPFHALFYFRRLPFLHMATTPRSRETPLFLPATLPFRRCWTANEI